MPRIKAQTPFKKKCPTFSGEKTHFTLTHSVLDLSNGYDK